MGGGGGGGGPQVAPMAAAPDAKLWGQGERIRIAFHNGSAAHILQVKEIASEWTRHANLDFEWVTAPGAKSDVRIKILGASGRRARTLRVVLRWHGRAVGSR